MTATRHHHLNEPRKTSASDLASLVEYWADIESPYVVTNSYEELERYVTSDVDCIADGDVLPRRLVETISSAGLQAVQVFQREISTYVVVVANPKRQPLSFFWLDIGADMRQEGRVFFDGREALLNRRRYGPFYVPEVDVEFGMYLVKKVIQRKMSQSACRRLSHLYSESSAKCDSQIERFWKGSNASTLIEAARSGRWASVSDRVESLRSDLYSGNLRSQFGDIWRYWIPEIRRRVSRVLTPSGLHVVFIGPDGSGKSSVIAGVESAMAPAFRGATVSHLFPGLTRTSSYGPAVTDPHSKTPRTMAGSFAKMAHWALEFGLGYFVRIRPRMVRSHLVLHDRYFLDILVDPLRYRYSGPTWLSTGIWRLLPKPDMVVLLDAPADVLHARKQEVSLEEAERQRRAYRALVGGMSNGHMIDATQSLEEVVGSVNEVILTHLSTRLRRRLGLPA